MSKTTTVSLVLKLSGTAGKDLNRITTDQIQQTKKIEANWNLSTQASIKFTNQLKQATTEVKTVNTATVDLVRTNRLLEGVNRQLSIQTRLISQQLKSQNRDYQLQTRMLSEQARHAQDLQRALAEAARNQRDIKNNTPKGGSSMLGIAGGVMGGAAAAYAVVRSPLERARSFETKIFDATTSITGGYVGMSSAQVKASNLQLSGYAKEAVRQGHGSVEGIGDAAGILAASGLYKKVDELKEPLKAIAKTSFAAGAEEQDVALLTRQIRQFGVTPDRTQAALDRATTSGFLGGFELKDMARLLPEVLPFAKTAGYSGEQGLNQVTTHMQLARKYTGLPSQAADNMRDLYNLFSQHHFSLAIGKYIKPEAGDPIKKIGLRGNRMGVDMTAYLANQKLEGVDPIIATVKLMNRQLSKNPRFVALQKEIAQAEKSGNADKATTLKKEAAQIVAAGEFGKIFHNQQSLSGLMSIIAGLNNGEFERIDKGSWEGVGAADRVSKEKAQIEPAQAHALGQEHILAQIKVYDSVKKTLGGFEQGLTDIMQANQTLTAAAYAAAGGLAVVAAAGFGSRIAGGVAGAAGGAATAGAAAGGMGSVLRATTAAAIVGRVAMGAGVGLAGAGGWYLGSKISASLSDETNHNIGGTIATIMSHMPDWMGGDTAREALAAEMSVLSDSLPSQNDRMIQQNERLIRAVERLQIPVSSDLLPLSEQMKQQASRGFPYR
jgi:hypothetical protein